MDIMALLETIEDILERSFTIPVFGKTVVEKDDILDIIKEVRLKLPDEIKQAKWVKEERHRILHEAQKEASTYIKDVETKLVSMVDEHEITKRAMQKAEEIIESAQQTAKDVHQGSKEYADEVLAKLEDILKDTIETIRNNREELR